MSTTENDYLIREFPAEFTTGDGRTLDVRIVPYGVSAVVSDNGLDLYREEWASSAFDDQLVAGHRLKVMLNFEHRPGIGDVVGQGIALRSMPDGLHGTFRMDEGPDGDKALRMVNDGILDSVSLEARPKKNGTVRTAQGVVRRVRAHLRNVALCREGAFADAKVLAVREAPIQELDEDLLLSPMDPNLVRRLRDKGFALPDRYQAHPAEDTSAEADTPETAPASDDNNDNSEV